MARLSRGSSYLRSTPKAAQDVSRTAIHDEHYALDLCDAVYVEIILVKVRS